MSLENIGRKIDRKLEKIGPAAKKAEKAIAEKSKKVYQSGKLGLGTLMMAGGMKLLGMTIENEDIPEDVMKDIEQMEKESQDIINAQPQAEGHNTQP